MPPKSPSLLTILFATSLPKFPSSSDSFITCFCNVEPSFITLTSNCPFSSGLYLISSTCFDKSYLSFCCSPVVQAILSAPCFTASFNATFNPNFVHALVSVTKGAVGVFASLLTNLSFLDCKANIFASSAFFASFFEISKNEPSSNFTTQTFSSSLTF